MYFSSGYFPTGYYPIGYFPDAGGSTPEPESIIFGFPYPTKTFMINIPSTLGNPIGISVWIPTKLGDNVALRNGQTITLHGDEALYFQKLYVTDLGIAIEV